MKLDTNKVLGFTSVAIGLVGLYLAWKFFSSVKKGTDAVGNTIGDAVAAVLVGPTQQVNAGVVLPTGERVSFNAIIASGSYLEYLGDENYAFTWKGVRYAALPPRRSDGYLNSRR